jgi:hypothetical protein
MKFTSVILALSAVVAMVQAAPLPQSDDGILQITTLGFDLSDFTRNAAVIPASIPDIKIELSKRETETIPALFEAI